MAFEAVSDTQLYERAMAGEEAAFTALYRRWQGGIYRFSLRISNSAAIAEDVTQEAFLSLMDGPPRFDPALGSFSAYLFGIARNHVLRRMTRERIFAPLADDLDLEDAASQGIWRESSNPLVDFTRREMVDLLHRTVEALPLRYREVVVLCELQELSYGDAARVIGCPEGTIRSRLHRARSLLIEKLREKAQADSRTPRIEPVRCLL